MKVVEQAKSKSELQTKPKSRRKSKSEPKVKAITNYIEIFVDDGKHPRLTLNLDQALFLARSIMIENDVLHTRSNMYEEYKVSTRLKKKFNHKTLSRFGLMSEVEQVISLEKEEFERILFIIYAHEKLLERQAEFYKDGSMITVVKSIIDALQKG